MSLLFDAEPIRGAITKLDINGKGSQARLDPGEPLKITGEYKAQNPVESPTDTVQLILFLNGKFFKCVYNDIPAVAPNYTKGAFSARCTAPTTPGDYRLRAGWAYNWQWPEQAYDYIRLAEAARLDLVGLITVGPAPAAPSLLPAALVLVPTTIIIGMLAVSKGEKK